MVEVMSKPEKRMRWSVLDKLALLAVIFGMISTVLWISFPTSIFIKQVSLTVENRTVRFVRELPFGIVSAQWRSEITLIDGDGYECNSGSWRVAEYQPIPGNTVTYDLGAWADRCIVAGPPFYLTTVRQALIFGVIPLRPDRQTTEVHGERPRGQVPPSQEIQP